MDLGLGTLLDLKAHLLNEALRDQTTWDQLLANLGRGVATRFDKFCNRNFSRVVGATIEFSADRTHYILPRYPIETITKVESRDSLNDGWVNLPIADVIQNRRDDAGLIDFVVQRAWEHSFIRITYTSGYWYPLDAEVQPSALQQGTVALAQGDETKAIVFPTAFTAAPLVFPTIVSPNGGIIIAVSAIAPTANGFTAAIGFPIPAAGYSLNWIAMLASSVTTLGPQELPAGATALPDDVKLAWLLQCQAVWSAVDANGLGLGNAEAMQKVMDSMARLELTPFVREILRGHTRYSMT